MTELTRYFLIFFGAMLIYNILLIRFIALCSFFGVSNSMHTSIGMGLAVIFVMTMATTVSWVLWTYILVPLHVGEFLYIPVFILVIAGLVTLVTAWRSRRKDWPGPKPMCCGGRNCWTSRGSTGAFRSLPRGRSARV